jgi:hypothetical protein
MVLGSPLLLLGIAAAQLKVPEPPPAADAVLEVTEDTLNGLVGRIPMSASSAHPPAPPGPLEECRPLPGLTGAGGAARDRIPLAVCRRAGGGTALAVAPPPVAWQWWITSPRFALAEGAMTFTATVGTRIGDQTGTETRTVPAEVRFDPATSRLRIEPGPFTVPLELNGVPLTQVDVARLYRLSVPVDSQPVAVTLPDGSLRTLTAGARSITVQYRPQRLVVGLDLGVDSAAPPAALRAAPGAGGRPPEVDPGDLVPMGRGSIKLYASALNEVGEKIEPVVFAGRYRFRTCSCIPGTSICDCLNICNSDYTARVTRLRFAIGAERVRVTGRVDARWCGASFDAALETTANVAYRSAHRAILVDVGPTNVQPVFHVAGYEVKLPLRINVAPALTLPPIPVATGLVHFETGQGPRSLRLSPSHVTLAQRDGHLELQAHVTLW